MGSLRNNFDSGPDGTTITPANSGFGPGNNAFDFVGSAGTGAYSTAFARPTAEYTGRFATVVSNGPCVGWSGSVGTQSQVWWRTYFLYTAYPVMTGGATLIECDNGTVYCAFVKLQSGTGILQAVNGPQTVSSSFSTVVGLNVWHRLEGRFQFSTTTGNLELRLYVDGDADAATPTETLSVSNWNLGASAINAFAYGYALHGANLPSMHLSGIELNDEGWPGPAPFRPGKGVPGVLTNPIAPHAAAS